MYKKAEKKRFPFLTPIFLCVFILALISTISAQSVDLLYPTPIVTNDLRGVIKARDVGDSRLTTYYYVFTGRRGDVFVNVVTKNLNGDIEVFTADRLRSRTKITLFADATDSETGRVIYMRKPERLILRVQGRTPNDDAATFRIRFAGSFSPMAAVASKKKDDFPDIDPSDRGTVRVNSVGTIITDKDETENETNDPDIKSKPTKDRENKAVNDDGRSAPEISNSQKKPTKTDDKRDLVNTARLIITDPFAKPKEEKPKDSDEPDLTIELKEKLQKSAIVRIERVLEDEDDREKAEEEKSKALAKIRLVILLKNGDKFTRRMSEISSVNVFDGVLKVVGINGDVRKFSIFDVVKMTIE